MLTYAIIFWLATAGVLTVIDCGNDNQHSHEIKHATK
jgi:hypothetical protein